MRRSKCTSIVICLALAAASLLLVGSADEESARRRQVEQMTPAEKAELARKYERFKALSPERRDQLVALNERLQNEPDGEALREVMRQYCDWLATLLLYERGDLERLPVDQRVQIIKEKRYGGQDARALRTWAEAHFETHGLDPRRLFADFWRRQGRLWDRRRRAQAVERGVSKGYSPRAREQAFARERDRAEAFLVEHFELENADLATLRGWLSPVTAEWLDTLSPDDQRRWVAVRLLDVIRPRRPPEVVRDEELAEFFQSKSLSDEERERLMRLPGDEMYVALVEAYRRAHRSGLPAGGPVHHPGGEPRLGPLPPHPPGDLPPPR